MFHKKKPYSLYNRYKLYEKGLEKYTNEFDAEYYAKSLRLLKVLIASTLDDSERYMAVYQHCNSLSLAKSNSETDSENEAIKKMPGYLSNNKNDIDHYHNTIDKFLQGYFKEKHTPKDLKMIKGAFTRKKLKNDQLRHFNLSRGNSFDEELRDNRTRKAEDDVLKTDDSKSTGKNLQLQSRIVQKKVPTDRLVPFEQ